MTHAMPRISGALCLLWMTACAPLSIYHKAGVSVPVLERETLRCEVSALKDAPVANQVRQGPPRFVPERQVCDSAGVCSFKGGFWVDGEIFTVDVNAPLRKRAEVQCMADKGYLPVQIAPCPGRIKASGQTTILPPLTDTSCVLRNRDGTWLVVERG